MQSMYDPLNTLEEVKHALGSALLAQIGSPRRGLGDSLARLIIAGKRVLSKRQNQPKQTHLADGMVLVTQGWNIRGTSGFTLGRYLFSRESSPGRLFLVHEYVHVLQWRAEGRRFFWRYLRFGLWNWPQCDANGWPCDNRRGNPYESQALKIEALYRRCPELPDPWLLV